jgi:hypothetical protein
MSRVAVSANLLSSSSSPPAATYPAATLHSDCGRRLVSKDTESMGREDKPLLDLRQITQHRRNHDASFTQTTGIR